MSRYSRKLLQPCCTAQHVKYKRKATFTNGKHLSHKEARQVIVPPSDAQSSILAKPSRYLCTGTALANYCDLGGSALAADVAGFSCIAAFIEGTMLAAAYSLWKAKQHHHEEAHRWPSTRGFCGLQLVVRSTQDCHLSCSCGPQRHPLR